MAPRDVGPRDMAPPVASLLASAVGYDVDTSDPAALKAALDRVNASISSAEAQVVAVVEGEHEAVLGALGSAEALRTQMDALRGDLAEVPCDSLRQRLEETVLKVPALRAKLADAQAEHAVLQSLAEVHERHSLFTRAMGPSGDLRVAERHARDLRDELGRLRALVDGTAAEHAPIVEHIAQESERITARLRESARAAWESAALGAAPGSPPASSLVLRVGGPTHLAALAASLHATGLAEQCVGELGEELLVRLLRPTIERPAVHVEMVEETAAEEGGVVLRLVGPSGEPVRPPDESGGADESGGLVARANRVCDAIEAAVTAAHGFLAQADAGIGDAGDADTPPLRLDAAFWSALRVAVCDDFLLPALAAELLTLRQQPRSAPVDGGAHLGVPVGGAGGDSGGGAGDLSEVAAALAARVGLLHSRLAERLRCDEVDEGTRALAKAAARLQLRAIDIRATTILEEARAILLDDSAEALEAFTVGPSPQPWRRLLGSLAKGGGGQDGGGEDGGCGDGSRGDDDDNEENSGVDDEYLATWSAAATGEAAEDAATLGTLPLTSLVFPRCRVSARAARLVALLHATLDDARASGAEGAARLYARARDLVDLFVAASALRWQAAELCPQASSRCPSSGVALVPWAELLLHNDALLLRHRCLTLGAEYALRLRPPLASAGAGGARGEVWPVVSFLDLAPELASLAADALRRTVGAAKSQLLLALSPGGNFERVGEDREAFAAAGLVVRRLAHELRKVCRLWTETLPQALACELAAELVEAPMTELVARLLRLRHISEADSQALQQALLVPLVRVGAELATENAGRGGAPHAAADGAANGAADAVAEAGGSLDSPQGTSSGLMTPLKAASAAATASGGAADGSVSSASLREMEDALPAVPCLRKALQLAWVLGARLTHVRERRAAGELDGLTAGELLGLLRALFEHAALQADAVARAFVAELERERDAEVAAGGR